MKINLSLAADVIAGASLALIAQTSYRYGIGIGLGEIGLAASTLLGAMIGSVSRAEKASPGAYAMARSLMIYFVAVLAPTTVIYWVFETPGTSLRDLLAYLLSFAFLYSVVIRETQMKVIVSTFLILFLSIVTYQFFYGSEQAWYWTRFTGGASNPNQLALYVVCGTALAAMWVRTMSVKVMAIAALTYFGIASLSDAYLAYLLALAVTGIVSLTVPRQYFLFGWLPLLVVSSLLVAFYGPEILEFGDKQWALADQGSIRLTLFPNGLKAWLDSPFSLLVGNGAGSFSGVSGPFGFSEAHNTPIDLLSMGGIIGLLVIYFYPVRSVHLFFRHEKKVLFSLLAGVLVFSLFHFVARHPIFWFTVIAAIWLVDLHRSERVQ